MCRYINVTGEGDRGTQEAIYSCRVRWSYQDGLLRVSQSKSIWSYFASFEKFSSLLHHLYTKLLLNHPKLNSRTAIVHE